MPANQPALLSMTNISIEFPGVKALDAVNLTLNSGKIQALVGANGAGKSTLMKILAGAYTHYTGRIDINDTDVSIRSPKAANQLGIHIVYQEVDTALIPNLSVAENIMLDKLVNEMSGRHFLSWQQLHKEAAAILERLHVKVPTTKLIQELTLAEKQMVLIARALSSSCRFLILDEPTAPLSQQETSELFRVVRELKNNQVGIIFISHRLPEVFSICEDVTVLRDGRLAATSKLADLTQNQLIEHMLGRRLEETFPKHAADIGSPLLHVTGLADEEKLTDITLTVHTGEIVGIAGLVGAGKTELCQALFGATPLTSGEIRLHDQPTAFPSPHAAVQAGLALVPEERRREGLLVEESVAANLTAANLSQYCTSGHFTNRAAEQAAAQQIIRELGIKTPDENYPVYQLSGGNQQKIAIGKWLLRDASLYLFDEPTKGVDVGAKKDIFELIGRLATAGKGILYASCELNELLGITDRLYVMYDGKIVKELITAATSEEEILFYATGGQ